MVVWGLSESVPDIQRLSLPIKLFLFLGLEAVLVRGFSWSPGHWLLGIHRLRIDAFAVPVAAEKRQPTYLVEPWLKLNERWWTILFGVLAILNGAKALVRWTMWTPAIPFMGIQLHEATSVEVLLALGTAECLVGCVALRLRPVIVILGRIVYGVTIASTVLSWQLWPAWVERYVLARRAFQGLPVREGEVEFMQQIVPFSIIATGLVMGTWMLVVAFWIRRVRTV